MTPPRPVNIIEISAQDLETGFSYDAEYVRRHLANAVLDENHPMHKRFEWYLYAE